MQFPLHKTALMPRQIRLNAFDMNCIGHQSPGLWTHPDDRADSYNTLEYWTDLARIAGAGEIRRAVPGRRAGHLRRLQRLARTALEQAVQVPVNDPLMVVPPMAMVTEHLGFGVTCALSYELPYPFARRMSTLDHLTKGRIGWNIVTGYLDSAARGMGMAKQVAHDDRYDVAEDYMQAIYKLWEASWEDGAVLRDRARPPLRRPRQDPSRFSMRDRISRSTRSICASPRRSARRCCSRPAPPSAAAISPPATPSACSSTGRRRRSSAASSPICARRAAAAGRDPSDLVIFTMMTVITDTTPQGRAGQVPGLPRLRVGGRRAGADVGLDRPGFRRHGPG